MDSAECLSGLETICSFTAKKYCSNHRFFFVLRRCPLVEDDSLYRGSVLSCSTRASVLSNESTTSSSRGQAFLETLIRTFPWRHYRPSSSVRTIEEDVTEPIGPLPPLPLGPDGEPTEKYELQCYKTREDFEAGVPPRQVLDLRRLLYISDFRQRVDGNVTQYCVSLSAEQLGLSFYFESENEWRTMLAHIRNAHVSVIRPESLILKIEYACNVVIRSKGLAKQTGDPKFHGVRAGPYRLLLFDTYLVFVKDNINRPVLTLYYQWIRQMVRQTRQPLLRRNESLFGLELGHMADTGEGFIYFRVLDEPTHADSAPGCSGLPKSPLSDMLQAYMKNNSIVRQRRRTQRSNRSRHSTSGSTASGRTSTVSSDIFGATSYDYRAGSLSTAQTMDTLISEFNDQASLSTMRSTDMTTGQNSGPSTDETSTPTVTKPPSHADSVSSSATHSSFYLTMDVGEDGKAPASPHRVLATATSSQASWGTGLSGSGPEPPRYVNADAMLPAATVGMTRQHMVSVYMATMASEAGDRTQRANSVGSKPAPKESVPNAMPRCCSDILGDSNNERALRWTNTNAHRAALVAPEPTSPDPALINQDLYVDYIPATNFERTASAGACSGIRPTQTAAPAPKTLGFGVDMGRMVGALSLVNTASTSTRSQLNSCSTTSSAVLLPEPELEVDDYGVMDFPTSFSNFALSRYPL